MREQIKEQLKRIIRENFEGKIIENNGADIDSKEDIHFIELGFDSISMMMLFSIIEEEFDIYVEDEDLTLDFETVDNMVEFIHQKLNG